MSRWPAVLLVLLPGPLGAQQDSVLRDAVRLVTEGQGDSARALVRARLAGLALTDSVYPEALYTAGVVAASADSATIYFRRVAIEFSQSAWADRSFLRLAQLAFAGGDLATSQRLAARLLSDYPLSPVRADAAYWSGRVLLEQGDASLGCRLLTQAADSARDNVELANQAAFYLQRCRRLARTPADTVADSTRRTTPAPASRFSVQVAAVSAAAAADEIMQSLRRAGFEPRVVRDVDGLLKVRVGRFKTRPEAQRLAAEVGRKLGRGSQPFVVEEP